MAGFVARLTCVRSGHNKSRRNIVNEALLLIDKALQVRFRDESLRYAYPLESWVIEQSTDPRHGMMTLRTADGFSVCFSIPREQQSELGEALVSQPPKSAMRAN